jgi:hypothetical protein
MESVFSVCERLLAFPFSCNPALYLCIRHKMSVSAQYRYPPSITHPFTTSHFIFGNGTLKSSLQSCSTKPSGRSKSFDIKNGVLYFFPPQRQCPLCIHSLSSGLLLVAAEKETLPRPRVTLREIRVERGGTEAGFSPNFVGKYPD